MVWMDIFSFYLITQMVISTGNSLLFGDLIKSTHFRIQRVYKL